MRGKWLLFAGATILLAVAAGALSVYRQSTHRKQIHPPKTVQAAPAPVNDVSLQGVVQAQRVVDVPVPIDGTIENFGAETGQDVFEGQLLAHVRNQRLDTALEAAQAELEKLKDRVTSLEASIIAERLEASRARADASRAKSDFERAQKAFERQQMLYREGATPRLVFEKSQREYTAAKEDLDMKEALAQQAEDRVSRLTADRDLAEKRLNDQTETLEQAKADVAAGDVLSPVDGVVISRMGSPGEEVQRGAEGFFRIAVALSAMEIAVQPEPAVLPRIRIGQPVAIHCAEVPEEITGTVREIKEGRVIVDFTSPTPAIRPGLTARVLIKLS
jgi:multidrug resistance efflux pump